MMVVYLVSLKIQKKTGIKKCDLLFKEAFKMKSFDESLVFFIFEA